MRIVGKMKVSVLRDLLEELTDDGDVQLCVEIGIGGRVLDLDVNRVDVDVENDVLTLMSDPTAKLASSPA